MTFLDLKSPPCSASLDGLVFTCVGVPANRSRPPGPPGVQLRSEASLAGLTASEPAAFLVTLTAASRTA